MQNNSTKPLSESELAKKKVKSVYGQIFEINSIGTRIIHVPSDHLSEVKTLGWGQDSERAWIDASSKLPQPLSEDQPICDGNTMCTHKQCWGEAKARVRENMLTARKAWHKEQQDKIDARNETAKYRVYFCVHPGAEMKHNSSWPSVEAAESRARKLQDKGFGTEIRPVEDGSSEGIDNTPWMDYEDAGKEAYAEERVIVFKATPTGEKFEAHPDGHYVHLKAAEPASPVVAPKALTRADIAKMNEDKHTCGHALNREPACGCMCGRTYMKSDRSVLLVRSRYPPLCQCDFGVENTIPASTTGEFGTMGAKVSHPTPVVVSDEDLYYVQDKRQYCGNSVFWWKPEGNGYTCDLDKAWKVTREKAERMMRHRPDVDVAWPVALVDAGAQRHFDMQDLRELKSL